MFNMWTFEHPFAFWQDSEQLAVIRFCQKLECRSRWLPVWVNPCRLAVTLAGRKVATEMPQALA
jgi:hypothetical protein